MAAEDEGRTEEASEFKLQKARKEGRVAKSQEVASSLVLLLSVVTMIFLGKWVLGQCVEILQFYFSRCLVEVDDSSLVSAFFNFFARIVFPVAVVGIVGGFVGNIIQTKGIIFSLKPIEPKLSKILPKVGEYLKKTMFSLKGLFNIGKSFGKVIAIAVIAYYLIKKDLFVLIEIISNGSINLAISRIAVMAAQMLLIVAIIFLVISIPDYFIQKKEFLESMKMTKQEQKEEYKEMEGDPEIKGHLKQMQKQLLSQNIPKAVSESDVVITNPTHYAVALKYDRTESDSPKVMAKGEDLVAQSIKKIAKENNVPIVENRPVARGLYTETKVGDIIPETYYRAIALIYSHLKTKNF